MSTDATFELEGRTIQILRENAKTNGYTVLQRPDQTYDIHAQNVRDPLTKQPLEGQYRVFVSYVGPGQNSRLVTFVQGQTFDFVEDNPSEKRIERVGVLID